MHMQFFPNSGRTCSFPIFGMHMQFSPLLFFAMTKGPLTPSCGKSPAKLTQSYPLYVLASLSLILKSRWWRETMIPGYNIRLILLPYHRVIKRINYLPVVCFSQHSHCIDWISRLSQLESISILTHLSAILCDKYWVCCFNRRVIKLTMENGYL